MELIDVEMKCLIREMFYTMLVTSASQNKYCEKCKFYVSIQLFDARNTNWLI